MVASCTDCKHWNVIDMYGCECFEADTGEISHYVDDADVRCEDYEAK